MRVLGDAFQQLDVSPVAGVAVASSALVVPGRGFGNFLAFRQQAVDEGLCKFEAADRDRPSGRSTRMESE
ncbi:MAG: hypothetical protein WEB53_04535 [Akkermansiaceae bacterium]